MRCMEHAGIMIWLDPILGDLPSAKPLLITNQMWQILNFIADVGNEVEKVAEEGSVAT